MKLYLIVIILVTSCSCKQSIIPEIDTNHEDPVSNIRLNAIHAGIPEFEISDLANKVFEIGSKTHFTNSCSFYFECDCCAGELLFNKDFTFFYLDYCMSNESVRKGTYQIDNGKLVLNYGTALVSKISNEENHIENSNNEYVISDSTLEQTTNHFLVSRCDERLLLIDSVNEVLAI